MATSPTSMVVVPEWGVTFTVRALEPDELRLVVALTEAGRPAEAAATVWHLGVVSPAYSFGEALPIAAQGTDATQAVLEEIVRLTDAYMEQVGFQFGMAVGIVLGNAFVTPGRSTSKGKKRRKSRSR